MKLLLVIKSEDAVCTGKLNLAAFQHVYIRNKEYITWIQLRMEAERLGCTAIATTYFPFFVTGLDGTQEDNAGSLHLKDGMRILLLPSLRRAYAEPHMKFMLDLWLSKLRTPHSFVQPDPFSYEVVSTANLPVILSNFRKAFLCAVDIETIRDGLAITSCSWTIALPTQATPLNPDGIRTLTYVVDFLAKHNGEPAHMDALTVMRTLNATEVPKVLQNGMYDCMYFARFGAPMRNWLFDTYNMQHCMYVELPKDLAFQTQMYCLKVRYWKDMAGSNRLEYNGRDTHATLWTLLGQLRHVQVHKLDYVQRNYMIEFRLVFPCLHCDLEGMAVDDAERQRLKAAEQAKADAALARLQKLTGVASFNPSSPVQMLNLVHALGHKDIKATGKIEMQTVSERDPIAEYVVLLVQRYRKARKAVSTYFEFDLLNGRFMYHLDPGGTESGRFASKASAYWCGTQAQNIPLYAKSMIVPDKGWKFGSADGSQAESRCTAYLSQDKNLMYVVETSPDFHRTNASMFFGIPFEQINTDIRNLSKRVNHGANYNMGPFKLVETMGARNIFKARKLLDLPAHWSAQRIAKYLLEECFCNAYPELRTRWYPEVVREVMLTGKLVGPTGWTRRTFLQPDKNKLHKNSVVAHGPQSLSVMQVNEAFFKVWRAQMTTLRGQLRIKAQVHDEILFQYREGCEHVAHFVSQTMIDTTITVHGRTMRIPNEPKFGADNWRQLK